MEHEINLGAIRLWLLENDHQCSPSGESSNEPCWCSTGPYRQVHQSKRPQSTRQEIQPNFKKDQHMKNPKRLLQPQLPSQLRQKQQSTTSPSPSIKHESKRESSDAIHTKLERHIKRKSSDTDDDKDTKPRKMLHFAQPPPPLVAPKGIWRLPEYLRIRVYQYLFPVKAYHWYWHDRELRIKNPLWRPFLRDFTYPVALLRTCRLLHAEAKTMMYSRLMVVCDLRPDRSEGFQLSRLGATAPDLRCITHLVINLMLDVTYMDQGYRYIDPRKAKYEQLGQLVHLKKLGLRVNYDARKLQWRGEPWYDKLMQEHLLLIMAAVPRSVHIEGVHSWGRVWLLKESCATMEMELSERAAQKDWLDRMIFEAITVEATKGLPKTDKSAQLRRQL